jgi:hypothetical protein
MIPVHFTMHGTEVATYKLIMTFYDTNSSIYCTKVAKYGTRCPDMKPNFQYINSFLQFMTPIYQCMEPK